MAAAMVAASVFAAAPGVDADEGRHNAPIQPGAPFCVPPVDFQEEQPCGALGFVLRGKDDRLYVTGPAHGFGFSNDPNPKRAYTGPDGPFPYGTTLGFGTAVIDDDTESTKGGPGTGSDVALIMIDVDKEGFVKSSVRHWTGPTGVLSRNDGAPGDPAYSFIGPDETGEPVPGRGSLITKTSNHFNSTMQLQERPGASGSPFLYAKNGMALGLNGNCLCGTGVFGYPTLDYVLRRFAEHYPEYGQGLRLMTARYNPPASPSP